MLSIIQRSSFMIKKKDRRDARGEYSQVWQLNWGPEWYKSTARPFNLNWHFAICSQDRRKVGSSYPEFQRASISYLLVNKIIYWKKSDFLAFATVDFKRYPTVMHCNWYISNRSRWTNCIFEIHNTMRDINIMTKHVTLLFTTTTDIVCAYFSGLKWKSK